MELGQIIFLAITLLVFYKAYKGFYRIYRNIKLGKQEVISGDESNRLKNMIFVALGQKKMFKRWIPAFFHLFIYLAFLMTQVELIEIFIDGIFGTHRFFAPFLGILYTGIISFIEMLSLLAFVATIVFLSRRNIIKLPRLFKGDLKGFPSFDANLILLGEILLIIGIFTMNGADMELQSRNHPDYHHTGHFLLSQWTGPLFFGNLPNDAILFLERFGWWLHLMVVFGFILYLPFSKHLHIFLAFFNTYFAKLTPRGEMSNMPAIMHEVQSMFGIETKDPSPNSDDMDFGANDIFSLSWRNLLEAYSCTECGRCTSVCPANLTGKLLSPRKIMMDIRDRADEVGANMDAGLFMKDGKYDDGKSLFDRIQLEEIHACTTCNACVEACPVMISPLDSILQLRRYEILTMSAGPQEWLPMFNSLENSGSVWAMTQSRDEWARHE